MTVEQASEVIKMFGLVTGGLWAAWTFQKLQKVRAAELANNKTLTDIQKSRIEQEEIRARLLRQQPQLAVQLNVSETAPSTEPCRSFLCVTVILKNEGEQNLQVDFGPSALTVGRLVFEKDGRQKIEDVHRFGASYFIPNSNEPQMLSNRIFKIGQKRQMVLAILPVTEPGGYLIQFNASFSRTRFDSEERSEENSDSILAIEQAFYYATGKPPESSSTSERVSGIAVP